MPSSTRLNVDRFMVFLQSGWVLSLRLRRRDVRFPGFVTVLEAADLPLGFFLADAVGFLHLARELIATRP